MINVVKEKRGGPEEPWQLPFTVVREGFFLFTKSYYVLGTGLRLRFSSEQTKFLPSELPSHVRRKTESQIRDVVRRWWVRGREKQRGGFTVLNGDAGRGLLGKWHLNQGQGEGRVVCSILVEKVISLSLPYPVQAHPACMSNSYPVMKWFCFCFSPMLYLGAGDWLLFSPALNASVWHIIGAGCNN